VCRRREVVRRAGNKRTVIDGPFTEAKELTTGFWLIQAKSGEEAMAAGKTKSMKTA
jgi:hypothetical protein